MRYLILLTLLLLSGCYYGPYGYGYGYGYGYPYRPYPPNYYTSAPPSYSPPPYSGEQRQQYYGGGQPGYGNPAANDPNNCGTPDQPRPCYR
jgi:hypothetical protein